jgi:threonine dehydrogenase-like Zn-dependent dehydrogenase
MTLHLWEIIVWSGPSFHEFVGIVEEVKTKVKDTPANGFRVNEEMFLVQVPTSGTMD